MVYDHFLNSFKSPGHFGLSTCVDVSWRDEILVTKELTRLIIILVIFLVFPS